MWLDFMPSIVTSITLSYFSFISSVKRDIYWMSKLFSRMKCEEFSPNFSFETVWLYINTNLRKKLDLYLNIKNKKMNLKISFTNVQFCPFHFVIQCQKCEAMHLSVTTSCIARVTATSWLIGAENSLSKKYRNICIWYGLIKRTFWSSLKD